MRARAVAGGCVVLVMLCAVAVETVLAPAPGESIAAIAALGPIDGWRCVHQAVLEYDPRWPRLSGGLLSEAPEALLTGVRAERIEIDLHSGDAVVWTQTRDEKRLVYELRPGHLEMIAQRCVGHLGAWRVVSEQNLD